MRVLVFGNSGSGKSTLARRLAARHALTLLDLDGVVWSPTELAVFRPESEIAAALDQFVRANSRWVIEGCYGRWMEHLAPSCTEMVFLNPGEATCLRHCRDRPWESHKYPSLEAQAAQLPFLLEWVRGYATRSDDLSLAAHRRVFDAFGGAKREITRHEPEL